MVKKNSGLVEFPLDLTMGGLSISSGSILTQSLPVTPATAGIQSGFSAAAGFTPVIASAGALGIISKQLKGVKL